MREEIKRRLEQMQAGDVPENFVKTDVGIMPNEWEVSKISLYLLEFKKRTNDIEKYPLYSSSRKGLLRQSEYYANKEAVETNLGYKIVPEHYVTYRHMSDDDVFYFNINSTGSEILVSSEYPVFTTKNMDITYLTEHLNNMPRFLYYCRAQKLGGTRTRLYFKVLQQYKLAIAPLPEQQKIAEILTHCDTVIALKQHLIGEERDRKKWLMQKLLNKGDQCVRTSVGKLTDVLSGATPSTNISAYWGGNIRWMNSGELNLKRIYEVEGRITEEGLKNSGTKMLPERCVLVGLAGQGKTRGTVAMNYVPLCTNQSIAAILPNE